jgi:hypothetical protein|tara:strand:+ start:472 stop:621 length:150 start_codon:yes stop_codon:yes gene_type:complete
MKKAYKYYTGETVWSLDGESWFITDDAKDTTKPIERPIKSRIALDISKI